MIINSPIIGAGGGGAMIKSIQSGNTSMTGSSTTVTISSVDRSKSFLTFSWRGSAGGSDLGERGMVRGFISSNTQLSFARFSSSDEISDIRYFVIEFESGVNVQHKTVTVSGTTADVSINAVNIDKSFIIGNYYGYNNPSTILTSFQFTSNTNVRAQRNNSAGNSWCAFSVVEFL